MLKSFQFSFCNKSRKFVGILFAFFQQLINESLIFKSRHNLPWNFSISFSVCSLFPTPLTLVHYWLAFSCQFQNHVSTMNRQIFNVIALELDYFAVCVFDFSFFHRFSNSSLLFSITNNNNFKYKACTQKTFPLHLGKKTSNWKGWLDFFVNFPASTRYNAICNECILFYSNLRYKFRLNCFTNDMSRVFHSPLWNYWWHRKCFFRGVSLATGKAIHILRLEFYFQKFWKLEAVENTMTDWVFDR